MSEPTKKQPSPPRRRKPLIYLVDDESLLLDLAELTLEPDGYDIEKFQDPEQALASFRDAKIKPALLISDYAMDTMNGLELIEQCKRLHPELKTILVSGTAGVEIILDSQVEVDRFMGKPYQPASLSELVRRLLEQ